MTTYEQRQQLDVEIEKTTTKLLQLKTEKDKNNALQLAFKLVINGFYGAMAARHFVCFCNDVAGSVTAHGREMLEYMMASNEEYWYEHWHLDTAVHEKLGISTPKQITRGTVVTSYGDTDSCAGTSLLRTSMGDITIEDLYNWLNSTKAPLEVDAHGHEIITLDKTVTCLNYTAEKGVYDAPVKKVIRHKVTKEKWLLKTKSGKEIYVTNDHSMVVFRDGVQIVVKPREILKTDKILSIK